MVAMHYRKNRKQFFFKNLLHPLGVKFQVLCLSGLVHSQNLTADRDSRLCEYFKTFLWCVRLVVAMNIIIIKQVIFC